MRSLKSIFIFGLAVFLLLGLVGCKKLDLPTTPDLPPTPPPNDDDEGIICTCSNTVEVDYPGSPTTATSCRWEMTLYSIEFAEELEDIYTPGKFWHPKGIYMIFRVKFKNVWYDSKYYDPEFCPGEPNLLTSVYGGAGKCFVESNLGYTWSAGDTHVTAGYTFEESNDGYGLGPGEESLEIVTLLDVYSPDNSHTVEQILNSQLIFCHLYDGWLIAPELEGVEGCGHLEQMLRFRLNALY